MAVAGSIVANLVANTNAWTSTLAGAVTPLNTLAVAVAGFAIAGVQQFLEVGSALDDMSQRTGMAVESLSSLRYTAQMTDTDLAALQTGLIKMNQFLAEASKGGADTAQTLQRLGLRVGDLANLSAEEQLRAFAEALSQVDDVGQRSVLAMKVFGKGAIDLLPLLSLGADGLETMSQRAEKLGLIMSADSAAEAAAFADTLDELKFISQDLAMQFGAELTPILQSIGDLMVYVASDQGEWVRQMVKTALAIAFVVAAINVVIMAQKAWAAVQAFTLALQGPKGWVQLGLAIGAAGGAMYAMNQQLDPVLEDLQQNKEQLDQNAPALERFNRNSQEAARAQRELAQAMESAMDRYRSYLPLATQISMETESIEASWRKAHEAGIDFALTWDQMKALQDKIVLDRSGFASEWTAVTDEIRILRGEISETELALQRMMEAGVPREQIDQLRQMYAERDQLMAEQRQADQAQQDSERRFTQIADRVRDSLSTPVDDFEKQMSDLRDAVLAGFVDPEDAMAFATAERDRIAKELMNPSESAALTDRQAINEAISINSDTANQQLTSLLNRRGNQSWEARMTDEQRKAREELEQVNAQLVNTNGYLSQWRPVESRSLRGRS